MNLQATGDKVRGEYNYLPAFKNKKRGSIKGTINESTVEGQYTFSQEGYQQRVPVTIILQEESEFKKNIAKIDSQNQRSFICV